MEHRDRINAWVALRYKTRKHHAAAGGGGGGASGIMRGGLKVYKQGKKTSFTTHPLGWDAPCDKINEEGNNWDEASPSSPAWWEPIKNTASLQFSSTSVRLFHLPGVKVLRPRLQNVWEADCEVSQGDYGVGSDHGEGGALQHREHQPDVFFTNRWTDGMRWYIRRCAVTHALCIFALHQCQVF